jgi:hypothetical protein
MTVIYVRIIALIAVICSCFLPGQKLNAQPSGGLMYFNKIYLVDGIHKRTMKIKIFIAFDDTFKLIDSKNIQINNDSISLVILKKKQRFTQSDY